LQKTKLVYKIVTWFSYNDETLNSSIAIESQLVAVYLNGRRFTWSNEQNPPTMVLLDRFLCTSDWEEAHGECHLRCIASVVSDHCPLLLDCTPLPPAHRRFQFEEFWL
jgi:hypothetical protein